MATPRSRMIDLSAATAQSLTAVDWKIGGRTRTRTLDPLIKSQLLYHLSYAPDQADPEVAH